MKAFLYKRRLPILLVLGGILTSLTLVAPDIGYIQWFSLIPAIIALIGIADNKEIKLRRAYGYGLLFFMSYYLVIFHWFLYMYPLEFAGVSKAAAAVVVCVAWFGLSFFQALGSAFVFVVFALIYRRLLSKFKILTPFLIAAIWTVFEWAQTIGWWGVPWGRLCLGQSKWELLLRSASIFGSYFITFVIVAVNACIALIVIRAEWKRTLSICAAGIFAFNLVLGAIVTLTYRDDGEPLTFAAVQGNISSSEKWNESSLGNTKSVYRKYTLEAAKNGADAVVWPETALPFDLFENEHLIDYVSDLAREANVTIFISAFNEEDYTDDDNALYNSIMCVNSDGSISEDIYSKQRLVPFGEFVPMRDLVMFLVPPLAEIGMLEDDLLFGDSGVVLDSEAGVVGCCICFDSIYENVARDAVLNGAEIMIVATNDSWFSDSSALDMHNSQSKLRAIETGRYVVRAANTGISSITDPMGNIKQKLGALTDGYVIDSVYLRDQITPYTYIGNLFVYVCMAFFAGVFICSVCLNKRSEESINSVNKS